MSRLSVKNRSQGGFLPACVSALFKFMGALTSLQGFLFPAVCSVADRPVLTLRPSSASHLLWADINFMETTAAVSAQRNGSTVN